MLYRYIQSEEPMQASHEERKELLPKCDICKVTIKKAGTITVKCCGSDQKESDQMSDDENQIK